MNNKPEKATPGRSPRGETYKQPWELKPKGNKVSGKTSAIKPREAAKQPDVTFRPGVAPGCEVPSVATSITSQYSDEVEADMVPKPLNIQKASPPVGSIAPHVKPTASEESTPSRIQTLRARNDSISIGNSYMQAAGSPLARDNAQQHTSPSHKFSLFPTIKDMAQQSPKSSSLATPVRRPGLSSTSSPLTSVSFSQPSTDDDVFHNTEKPARRRYSMGAEEFLILAKPDEETPKKKVWSGFRHSLSLRTKKHLTPKNGLDEMPIKVESKPNKLRRSLSLRPKSQDTVGEVQAGSVQSPAQDRSSKTSDKLKSSLELESTPQPHFSRRLSMKRDLQNFSKAFTAKRRNKSKGSLDKAKSYITDSNESQLETTKENGMPEEVGMPEHIGMPEEIGVPKEIGVPEKTGVPEETVVAKNTDQYKLSQQGKGSTGVKMILAVKANRGPEMAKGGSERAKSNTEQEKRKGERVKEILDQMAFTNEMWMSRIRRAENHFAQVQAGRTEEQRSEIDDAQREFGVEPQDWRAVLRNTTDRPENPRQEGEEIVTRVARRGYKVDVNEVTRIRAAGPQLHLHPAFRPQHPDTLRQSMASNSQTTLTPQGSNSQSGSTNTPGSSAPANSLSAGSTPSHNDVVRHFSNTRIDPEIPNIIKGTPVAPGVFRAKDFYNKTIKDCCKKSGSICRYCHFIICEECGATCRGPIWCIRGACMRCAVAYIDKGRAYCMEHLTERLTE